MFQVCFSSSTVSFHLWHTPLMNIFPFPLSLCNICNRVHTAHIARTHNDFPSMLFVSDALTKERGTKVEGRDRVYLTCICAHRLHLNQSCHIYLPDRETGEWAWSGFPFHGKSQFPHTSMYLYVTACVDGTH